MFDFLSEKNNHIVHPGLWEHSGQIYWVIPYRNEINQYYIKTVGKNCKKKVLKVLFIERTSKLRKILSKTHAVPGYLQWLDGSWIQ